MYDLLILGGGPAGYAAGIAAGRMGKSVALFEENRVGGACLNVGCIPTKYLLDKGALLEKIRLLTDRGVFRDAGAFSFNRIMEGKDQVVRSLTGGVAGLLKGSRVELVGAAGELLSPGVVRADGRTWEGKNVLICTGSEAVLPPIPGVKEHCVTSTELLCVRKVPHRLAVIGGGVIGVELASAFRAFGSEAVVLEMLPQLFPKEEPELVRAVSAHLERQGIQILTGARVIEISGTGGKTVRYELDGGVRTLEADAVLMAVGRRARLTGVDARKLGLATERGCVNVDEHMRTNLPGIWAAGDVTGGWQLAHSAYAEAETAVHNMFCAPGEERPAALDVMPRCVYTLPPFASVGMTRAEAEAAGRRVRSGKFPYAASGMALAEDEQEGFFLVHTEEDTGRILGAHLYGAGAHELVTPMSLAIRAGLTVDDWARTIIPHPSLSEGLGEAVLKAVGRARHIL